MNIFYIYFIRNSGQFSHFTAACSPISHLQDLCICTGTTPVTKISVQCKISNRRPGRGVCSCSFLLKVCQWNSMHRKRGAASDWLRVYRRGHTRRSLPTQQTLRKKMCMYKNQQKIGKGCEIGRLHTTILSEMLSTSKAAWCLAAVQILNCRLFFGVGGKITVTMM